MDADLVENLNDWKCGPRVVGGGDQTVVDGCGDLAVGCHRKSTFKVILADTISDCSLPTCGPRGQQGKAIKADRLENPSELKLRFP